MVINLSLMYLLFSKPFILLDYYIIIGQVDNHLINDMAMTDSTFLSNPFPQNFKLFSKQSTFFREIASKFNAQTVYTRNRTHHSPELGTGLANIIQLLTIPFNHVSLSVLMLS